YPLARRPCMVGVKIAVSAAWVDVAATPPGPSDRTSVLGDAVHLPLGRTLLIGDEVDLAGGVGHFHGGRQPFANHLVVARREQLGLASIERQRIDGVAALELAQEDDSLTVGAPVGMPEGSDAGSALVVPDLTDGAVGGADEVHPAMN